MTSRDDSSTSPASVVSTAQSPPHSIGGILRRLGPGLIIAGSIVGSGELIGTTKTAAEAGIWLLWLIVVGCVIKVFVQVEFGRFAITEGRTTMEGMNLVPGPRLRANWLMWYWLMMFLLGLGQLGGIVGGVGESLAITFPLRGDFLAALEREAAADGGTVIAAPPSTGMNGAKGASEEASTPTYDNLIWGGLVTVITSVLLVNGKYQTIQSVATVLVAAFTAVTVCNLWALQSHAEWATSWSDLVDGMSFRLPPGDESGGTSPLFTALATFGIIGVGASELIAYPYWCLEKGYARYTGTRDESDAWAVRARGWLRVMHWDVWCSLLIYTFATVAFYLLGAAVLHRAGLNPGREQMIRTLAEMYAPVFGAWARPVFLFGAVAVLYSTFFVATAGNSRMASDALRVFRLRSDTEAARLRWVRLFCGMFPFISFFIYAFYQQPVTLVLISGLAQSIMLPMLGGAALYFRYQRVDPRLRPGVAWDVFLWLSCAGMLVTGGFGVWKALNG